MELLKQEWLNKEVKFDEALKYVYIDEQSSYENISAIFYDGEMYKGKETKVFAYLGIPKHEEKEVLPAVVLVHGGDGTAFSQWVKIWVDRGYAAIAMDLNGAYPEEFPELEKPVKTAKHNYAGPKNDTYGVTEPPEEVWMYHAVADVIFAHNILRSLSCVDRTKIGIVGSSWGGIVTSTVVGLDARFAFAVSTYGCGYLYEARTKWSQMVSTEKQKVWDPSNFLKKATIPMLWVNGDRDGNFDISIFSKSAQLGSGERMISLRPAWGHARKFAQAAQEIYSYADYMVRGGTELISFEPVELHEGIAKVRVIVPAERRLTHIRLIANVSDEIQYYRAEDPAFKEIEGVKQGENYVFQIPEDALRFYISAWDEEGNVTSSFVYEIAK